MQVFDTVIRRAIPGFPDYFVDNTGDVWSRKSGKLLRLSPGLDTYGYPYVVLYVNGKPFNRKVHRLVMLTFVGPLPKNHHTDHKDFIRINNYLSNLHYLPKGVNSCRLSPEGRLNQIKGARMNTPFSVDIAKQAVRDYRAGNTTHREVALKHKMDTSTVTRLCLGQTRAYILAAVIQEEESSASV